MTKGKLLEVGRECCRCGECPHEFTLAVGIGERVSIGSPLATLEKSGGVDGLETAAAELLKAFKIAPFAEARTSLILERIM